MGEKMSDITEVDIVKIINSVIKELKKDTTKNNSIKNKSTAETLKSTAIKQKSIVKSTSIISNHLKYFIEVPQEKIIKEEPTRRILVNAGPGTGKTYTLIQKIIYMISVQDISPDDIMILCFSRAAVAVIRERLEDAENQGMIGFEWRALEVRTFDSFATWTIAYIQKEAPGLLPRGFKLGLLNYDERIQQIIQLFNKPELKNSFSELKHFIVDEVQDLVDLRAELVLSILSLLPKKCGFTLMGDSCQSIYDYQVQNDNNSKMNSEAFYEEFFRKFYMASNYSLTVNHRQNNDRIAQQYRNMILQGDLAGCDQYIKQIDKGLKTVPLRSTNAIIKKCSQNECSLGILTRKNGQALLISKWLRGQKISHQVLSSTRANTLGDWLAEIFMNYSDQTIDENRFEDAFENIYTGDYEPYWNAIISTQIDKSKSVYNMEDILIGILNNAKDPLLFDSVEGTSDSITVSTIHKAKGREFDYVLVDPTVFEDDDYYNNDLAEHKVRYVALTRYKEAFAKISLDARRLADLTYISSSKGDDNRAFQKKYSYNTGKPYLYSMAVGRDGDIKTESFAYNVSTQNYIEKYIKHGTELKMIKCCLNSNNTSKFNYKVVYELSETRNLDMCYTTDSFNRAIDLAIRQVKNLGCTIYGRLYPMGFMGVRVDKVCTYVGVFHGELKGVKRFGNMCIWRGFTVTGLGRTYF